MSPSLAWPPFRDFPEQYVCGMVNELSGEVFWRGRNPRFDDQLATVWAPRSMQ